MKVKVEFIDHEKARNFERLVRYFRLFMITTLILLFFMIVVCFADEGVKASWYSNASLVAEGTWKKGEQRMANGERFDENALTCAARLFPLGTFVKITNKKNNKTVIVKVTDRIGKRFAKTRIDLSKGAFARIAKLDEGVIPIEYEVIR